MVYFNLKNEKGKILHMQLSYSLFSQEKIKCVLFDEFIDELNAFLSVDDIKYVVVVVLFMANVTATIKSWFLFR